jgi:hypothetical protein
VIEPFVVIGCLVGKRLLEDFLFALPVGPWTLLEASLIDLCLWLRLTEVHPSEQDC